MMNNLKKILLNAGLIIISSASIIAQSDRHASLFYGNALSNNPAAAGMLNGDLRLFSSYRNQWSSVTANPFKTMNFSVDGKVLQSKIKKGVLGMGLSYYNDKAGVGNLTHSNIGLALSYAIEVDKDVFLSIGAQGGYAQYKIGMDNFTWGNQWVGDGYDQTLSSYETGYANANGFFDMSAGVYLHGSIGSYIDLEGGVAVNHILGPNVAFNAVADQIYRNISVSLFPEFRLPYKRIAIIPGIYSFFQGPNMEFTLGTDIKYYIKESSHFTGYYEEVSASIGTFWRSGDAVVIAAGFNYSGITAGIAYDFNYSKLRLASSTFGAYEVFLRYRLGFGYKFTVGGKGKF